MPETLKKRITDAMKAAMKDKQKERLVVIRNILAAVKQKEVDERVEVDDEMLIAILDKQLKQRKESAKIYQQAGRDELLQQETFEMEIIQEFLPEALSEEAIVQLIDEAISSTNATGMKDMGKVMGILKPQVQGKADMAQLSQMVKSRLS